MSGEEGVALANGDGEMFDRIAARYDVVNRIVSFGLDQPWRSRLVRAIGPRPEHILDVATGTADVAIRLAKTYPDAKVTGVDVSDGMLEWGRKKVASQRLADRVTLVRGDAETLPFEDNTFSATTISFGIRNVPDRLRALREMVRVTKPGGTIAVLELAMPAEPRAHLAQRRSMVPAGNVFLRVANAIGSAFARFHVRHVLPAIGVLLGRRSEYLYLRTSIEAFPSASTFMSLMEIAGAYNVTATRLSFGAAVLFVGKK